MADKPKTSTKVTRIKATDDTPSKAKSRASKAQPAEVVAKASTKAPKTAKASKASVKKTTKPAVTAEPIEGKKNVFARIGGYFKGAWIELKQVRWPTRKATWSLTLAVILFSAFFGLLILLLDTLFKYIFQLIIT